MSEFWASVAAERGALIDDLADLTDAQWNSPTLCPDWTVHDMVAHLCAAASLNPATFLASFAGAGFNFNKFANRQIVKRRRPDPAATLGELRRLQNSTTSPPGPKATWLGEVVIHSAEIRRPLGMTHSYTPGAVREVADFYKGSNTLIGAKTRITGLALRATDEDWSHGDGESVEGPILSLVLAMTGRRAACDDLAGDGVTTLQSRCP